MTNQNLHYTKHHPKWHRTRMPIFWWVHKWVHMKFILRELTSVAVALYALVLLFQIWALSRGPEAYASFSGRLKTPISIVLHAVAFLFVIFHSVTWFNLSPRALVVRIGKNRIPDAVIAASNYVAWVIFSAAIAWIMLSNG
jgi:fumarate reductase subunit C